MNASIRPDSDRTLLLLPAALLLLLPTPAHASTITRDQLAADIATLQTLTAQCRQSAASCDPDKVPANATIGDPTHPGGYTIDWNWLRNAITDAKAFTPDHRQDTMQQASARLASIAAELNPSTATANFPQAESTVRTILARDEFRAVEAPTWWDRLTAKFWAWINRFFTGIDDLGSNNPWLMHAFEILFFTAAATGLFLFVYRTLARQRLRVALGEGAANTLTWTPESRAWAALAEQRAAAADWREAIHCLYWAAIIQLEKQRAFRPDPSRTPREYLRLLPQSSTQRRALTTLTTLLERLWYGPEAAARADYEHARTALAALQSPTTPTQPINPAPEPA